MTRSTDTNRIELEEFRDLVERAARRVFAGKLRRRRAVLEETADDGSRFSIRPAGRNAAPIYVSVDSVHQISLFTGEHSLPLILAERNSFDLLAQFRRHLTAIRRGQYRESLCRNGRAYSAVAEIGRGFERAFLSYNTLRTRIDETPRDWVRVRYQAY